MHPHAQLSFITCARTSRRRKFYEREMAEKKICVFLLTFRSSLFLSLYIYQKDVSFYRSSCWVTTSTAGLVDTPCLITIIVSYITDAITLHPSIGQRVSSNPGWCEKNVRETGARCFDVTKLTVTSVISDVTAQQFSGPCDQSQRNNGVGS